MRWVGCATVVALFPASFLTTASLPFTAAFAIALTCLTLTLHPSITVLADATTSTTTTDPEPILKGLTKKDVLPNETYACGLDKDTKRKCVICCNNNNACTLSDEKSQTDCASASMRKQGYQVQALEIVCKWPGELEKLEKQKPQVKAKAAWTPEPGKTLPPGYLPRKQDEIPWTGRQWSLTITRLYITDLESRLSCQYVDEKSNILLADIPTNIVSRLCQNAKKEDQACWEPTSLNPKSVWHYLVSRPNIGGSSSGIMGNIGKWISSHLPSTTFPIATQSDSLKTTCTTETEKLGLPPLPARLQCPNSKLDNKACVHCEPIVDKDARIEELMIDRSILNHYRRFRLHCHCGALNDTESTKLLNTLIQGNKVLPGPAPLFQNSSLRWRLAQTSRPHPSIACNPVTLAHRSEYYTFSNFTTDPLPTPVIHKLNNIEFSSRQPMTCTVSMGGLDMVTLETDHLATECPPRGVDTAKGYPPYCWAKSNVLGKTQYFLRSTSLADAPVAEDMPKVMEEPQDVAMDISSRLQLDSTEKKLIRNQLTSLDDLKLKTGVLSPWHLRYVKTTLGLSIIIFFLVMGLAIVTEVIVRREMARQELLFKEDDEKEVIGAAVHHSSAGSISETSDTTEDNFAPI